VGCDGSPEGFSTVIVRTERGESVFEAIDAEGFVETKPADIAAIREIGERKRRKAAQTKKICDLRSAGLGAEEIRLGIELEKQCCIDWRNISGSDEDIYHYVTYTYIVLDIGFLQCTMTRWYHAVKGGYAV